MSWPDKVSMVEFRRRAEEIIGSVQRGRRVILTYRGKPVVLLSPVTSDGAAEDDPFYALPSHAVDEGDELTNAEMDEAIYGD